MIHACTVANIGAGRAHESVRIIDIDFQVLSTDWELLRHLTPGPSDLASGGLRAEFEIPNSDAGFITLTHVASQYG